MVADRPASDDSDILCRVNALQTRRRVLGSMGSLEPPALAIVTIHSIHQGNGNHMVATTWQHRLDMAHGVNEIVAAARDYLATLAPAELCALPEGCRPPAKASDRDGRASERLRR